MSYVRNTSAKSFGWPKKILHMTDCVTISQIIWYFSWHQPHTSQKDLNLSMTPWDKSKVIINSFIWIRIPGLTGVKTNWVDPVFWEKSINIYLTEEFSVDHSDKKCTNYILMMTTCLSYNLFLKAKQSKQT